MFHSDWLSTMLSEFAASTLLVDLMRRVDRKENK